MIADARKNIWLERGNIVEFVITQGGVPLTDLSGLLRAVFCIGTVVADSDVEGVETIWWTDSVTDEILDNGEPYTGDVLRARLGYVEELVSGEYDECRLVVFDAANPNGVVVSDNISFNVIDACIES